jgi:hypothetical protein
MTTNVGPHALLSTSSLARDPGNQERDPGNQEYVRLAVGIGRESPGPAVELCDSDIT